MQADARRAWAQTLVGRTVAERYRLDELLDVGGMGAVFRGRHLEVDRPVAIKTVLPGALSDAQTERLRREARRAAAVGGRGVVDVTDFGLDEVCGPFLVMELLEGETLGKRLTRRVRLSPAEAFEIADAVLATLSSVHAQGLVHRDLKPENLFLAREEGEEIVKILDFGIARPVRSTGDTLTRPGAVVGTPRFMAPEQARGAGDVDARADVYAVGAILYAMLSGRPPYEELDSAEALVAVVAGPPRPVRELAPDVSEAMAGLIERAMRSAPEERFADATQMRAALRDAVGAPPMPAVSERTTDGATRGRSAGSDGPPTGEAETVLASEAAQPTGEPPPRSARAARWIGWLAAGVALALLGAWGSTQWPTDGADPSDAERAMPPSSDVAEIAEPPEPARAPEGAASEGAAIERDPTADPSVTVEAEAASAPEHAEAAPSPPRHTTTRARAEAGSRRPRSTDARDISSLDTPSPDTADEPPSKQATAPAPPADSPGRTGGLSMEDF